MLKAVEYITEVVSTLFCISGDPTCKHQVVRCFDKNLEIQKVIDLLIVKGEDTLHNNDWCGFNMDDFRSLILVVERVFLYGNILTRLELFQNLPRTALYPVTLACQSSRYLFRL